MRDWVLWVWWGGGATPKPKGGQGLEAASGGMLDALQFVMLG